ncbi:TATA-box-binding protein [Natrinema sp. 1APR25-10V2]|uniref:TATA-box-binding protein n=1 Tax=Natrinema sp. 1APR25-10V2 TaxID=2951081 RepID=UPI002876E897|nr:TATA-box-binding protein [Natrinema sp. 1APR25-10V2]MDS0476855.1 TATA-box-binding protein [Natrinema sp. 1APR25-10V2]
MSSLTDSLSTENVVASTSIEQELDLNALARDLDGVRFDPDQFPGLVYRTQEPKAASLLFRSGKLVCTGASSISAATDAVNQLFEELRGLGLAVPSDPTLTVQNIVTSGDLGASLNLNAIAIGLGLEQVEYEPEQFPGLVYRADDLDVVILLFGSGKLVITGGTEPDDAEHAIESVAGTLRDLGLLE